MHIVRGNNGDKFDFIHKANQNIYKNQIKKGERDINDQQNQYIQSKQIGHQLIRKQAQIQMIIGKVLHIKSLFISQSSGHKFIIMFYYIIQQSKLLIDYFQYHKYTQFQQFFQQQFRMDMVRGLNGNDWDNENEKNKQQQNREDKKEQQEKMKKNVEQAIQEEKNNDQFNKIK